MSQAYRIVIQFKQSNGRFTTGETLHTGEICHPETILQLGLRHTDQIEILSNLQNAILKEQSIDLQESIQLCPHCSKEVIRYGVTHSSFNAVFTDHKVAVHRLKCPHCQWVSVPSIKSLFGTNLHPDLVKLQCEHGSKSSYTDAQASLNRLSYDKRAVNNPMSVRNVVERVGGYLSENINEKIPDNIEQAKELIVQADGGHVKSKNKENRSFEALTSVVYKPTSIIPGKKKRLSGRLAQKHCAASALDDAGKHINALTLVAAQKEGLTQTTNITALCDGASNCWKIIDSLAPYCNKIESILDWFHIAKKFQNTRMGKIHNISLAKAKWSLWHGDIEASLNKLKMINNKISNKNEREKIGSLYHYIDNNRDRLVDYSERFRQGKVFTSHLAESNVESLINQRCKGKRHMQWSREGLHTVLQLRAAIASNDWNVNWENYILGAYPKAG